MPEDQRDQAETKFKAASQAYEILYDDDKRQMYDTHGMSAFDPSSRNGMGGEVDLDDILSSMFGMGMGGGGGRDGEGEGSEVGEVSGGRSVCVYV